MFTGWDESCHGVSMNSKRFLFVLGMVTFAGLNSCSGLGNKCTTNCGGGTGNASLSLTISDTTPTNASVVSFSLPIIGITLTSSSGSKVSVFSPSSATNFELTRLQTDTNLIANSVSVAAGTYTAVNVTVSAPSGVYINSTSAAIGSCVASGICALTGSAATITYTFPSAVTLTANGNQWIDLDFDYNNAVVSSSSGLSIDVTQASVMTATSTVPTGVASGAFANLDDFTGAVTAISSSSITVESSLRGSLTATVNSSTQVIDPLGQCTSAALSCIQTGSIVSLQGVLSTAGVPTATSLDVIDVSTSPADEVEGIIYPSSCNGGSNYGMILSDSTIFTSGSPLLSAGFGAGVCLTLSSTVVFNVDTGLLTQTGTASGSNFPGFTGTQDIFAGQVVRAKITDAASSSSTINASATTLILRFSRLTGTVSTTAGVTGFTITNLPPYLGTTFSTAPTVLTSTATLVEGAGSVGDLTGTVSMSALYLNASDGAQYWFEAQKVRQQ
jgi:Domain of unknown function (DUF4382)